MGGCDFGQISEIHGCLVSLFVENLPLPPSLQHYFMTPHALTVARTAHYYLLGTPGLHIRRYWLVCHGYAQLADEFLEAFRPLDDGTTLVVAPEGLNYFYKKGFGGPPGATWMTRQHRETEIEDYTAYLQQLHETLLQSLPADVQVVLLGFSQGVATITRWAVRRQPHCHAFVAWAGLLPEDEPYAAIAAYWKGKKRWFCYGNKDPFITPERMASFKRLLETHGLVFDSLPFEGGHEVPEGALRALERNLG